MADQYITFINRPTPIEDIVTDMKLYFADNGKSRSKCKLFDNKGQAGLPDDAYSVADLRLNIKLGETPSDDVIFSVDVIMEDGSYLSDSDPDYAKVQMPYEQAIKLTEITWVKDVVKPLIAMLQKYEDDNGAPEKETCKDIISKYYKGLGDPESLNGTNPRDLANKIIELLLNDGKSDKVVNSYLFDGYEESSSEYKKLKNNIILNLSTAIETNNEQARMFFNKYRLDGKSKNSIKFIKAYAAGQFPKIAKDDIAKQQVAKKKLNKNIDEPDEVISAFIRQATDPLYKRNLISRLKAKQGSAKSEEEQKVYAALLKAFTELQ